MKTYTEEQLMKAVEYACGYQKCVDYATASILLTPSFKSVKEADKAIVELLNELMDSNDNSYKEITIEDIEEHLNS